jgi:hypothetical protein
MNRIVLGFVVLLLVSCGTDSSEIGSGFFNGGNLDFSFIDTVSVKLSTIKYEDIVTLSSKRLLVGHHDDEKLGSITAATYFQVATPSVSTLSKLATSFNYLQLVLKYDKYHFYDTTAMHRFKVYRVTEEIEVDKDGYLYNHSTFAVAPDSLGAASFRARPNRDDSVTIQLDPALGMELYNKLVAGSTDLTDLTQFQRYLRGIAVFPDTTINGSILGFKPTAEIRLYYLDKSVTPSDDKKYVSFPVTTTNCLYFNHIATDTRGTKLQDKLPKNESVLSSDLTDNESYIQAGTGYAVRVDLPYIKNLSDVPNFYINSAILEVFPTHKSYDLVTPLPNLIVYPIYQSNMRASTSAGTPRLLQEANIPQDQFYQLDVTAFITQQFGLDPDSQQALLFLLDDTQQSQEFQASLSRVYMGAARTRLKIYYATIKEQK